MNKEWKGKIIYILLVAGLVWLYVTYVPFLLDYYVCRPNMGFGDFLQLNVANEVFAFETALMALMLSFLFSLTWNGGLSVGIMSLALFLLTHGSFVKYQNRKELLRLADFQLTEAAGMAAGYLKFKPDGYLLLLFGGLLLFVLMGVGVEYIRKHYLLVEKPGKFSIKDKKSLIYCGLRGVLAVAFGSVIFLHTTFFVMERAEAAGASKSGYEDNDRFILYHFVKNEAVTVADVENVEDSYDFLIPEEEGQEAVSDGDVTEKVQPNVIVIMNESWWNTDNIKPGSVKFSKDPMGPYKWLSKRCVTGHLTSNVYGGGTISSEAEFLTGINTKYYVTSSTIYEETLDRKLPSLVDYFNALAYETVAIHPYYGDFYSRDEVYETMGFDETVFEEDMVNREIYTRYISDDSLVDEIIAEYEEAGEEERKFIWSVSVANHRRTMNYYLDSVEDYDYPISVDLNGAQLEEEDVDTLVNYVNGIYLAGAAYEKLINYFAQKQEPVVVVMYGDHIPNFSVETLEVLGLNRESNPYEMEFAETVSGDLLLPEDVRPELSEEDMELLERMYSVPVVMWSNYELESEPEFDGESIYYLPQMLIESTGMPETEMSKMLKSQRKVFRANAREYVLDAEGKQITEYTDEQMETLNHGKIVIYDILFGENSPKNIWEPKAVCE